MKSRIFVQVGGLLLTGRKNCHPLLKKSRTKICTFQPVIIDPDRPPNISLCICSLHIQRPRSSYRKNLNAAWSLNTNIFKISYII